MTAATFPLEAGTRQSDILAGTGASATYGPFGFRIFDTGDAELWQKDSGDAKFTKRAASFAKVDPSLEWDYFTLTATIPASSQFQVRGARQQSRAMAVRKANKVDTDAIDKQLSQIGVAQLEQGRELGQMLRAEPGVTPPVVAESLVAGDLLVAGPSGTIKNAGLSAAAVAAVPEQMAAAEAARDIALQARLEALSASTASINASGIAGAAAFAAASAASEALKWRSDSRQIAETSGGTVKIFDTKASADAAIGAIADNDVIEVIADETRSNARTRYRKSGGVLVYKITMPDTYADTRAAELATDGFATVFGLDGSDLPKRTKLPFITPEMFGAPGDDTSHPLSERFATLLSAQMTYPDAISLTDEIDWCAWMKCIAVARVSICQIVANGRYVANRPIEDNAAGEEYWNRSIARRPITAFVHKLTSTSTDKAVYLHGRGAAPFHWTIRNISGPGMDAMSLGTPGSGDERIGVLVSGFGFIHVGSFQDFNYGVVVQGGFCLDIELGFGFACYKSIWTRLEPGNPAGTNQEITMRAQSVGGIFTGPGGPGDEYRRTRGAKLGVHLEYISNSAIDIGIGYCQLDDTSKFIEMDKHSFGNQIRLYMEGVRADGTFGEIKGRDNTIFLGGLGTPSNVKNGRFVVSGTGNHIYGLPERGTAAARTFLTANQSTPIIEIHPGNHVHGTYRVEELRAPSVLNHCLIHAGTTWTLSGTGAHVATDADHPSFLEDTQCLVFTADGADGIAYTSENFDVSAEARQKLKLFTAIKGVTNHASVALYIIDATTGLVIGTGVTSSVDAASDWQTMEGIDDLEGVTLIRFRIAVRNAIDGQTGCVVKVVLPYATFNIEAPLRRIGLPLDHLDLITGRMHTEAVRHMRPWSMDEQVVTDILGTALPTSGMGLVRVTAHPSGDFVNSITGMRDCAPVMILNHSASTIHLTTACGAWTSQIDIAPGEAFTVVKAGGDTWKVG